MRDFSAEGVLMTDNYKNLIAGRWQDGASTIENRNPSDISDMIGHFARQMLRNWKRPFLPHVRRCQPGGMSALSSDRRCWIASVAN